MKWSEKTWLAAAPVYKNILRHPFVRELAGGDLSQERFMFYIRQDSLYIESYSRVLAHIASRLPRKSQCESFLRFASDGIAVEKMLHEHYLQNGPAEKTVPTPATLLYTSYELSKSMEPVEIEAASILPCFWVYQRVGEWILDRCSPDNPYVRWIDTYADETFAESTRWAIEICDELADMANDETRKRMTDVFVTGTRMEWMFWDSAYRMEGWPV